MPFAEPQPHQYDLAVIGTGFAGSFFLARYLEHASLDAKVVVLERGSLKGHAERVSAREHDYIAGTEPHIRRSGEADKRWIFSLGFGGGSNCWWGNAPRFLPADFAMHSGFGVGRDWPISYDDLEPYYDQAEAIISLSGGEGQAPYRRGSGYQQPPHLLSHPERLLKEAYPDTFFHMPCARSRTNAAGRGICCANAICHLCPVDAKFTVQNAMMEVYEDPRVTVSVDSEVTDIDHVTGLATGLAYTRAGRQHRLSADLIVLAANGIFNPVILERSGLTHPLLGKRLHEQVGLKAEALLDGVEGFGGSTSVTGIGYMLYADEARRREMAGCLLETWNFGMLRNEFGKWRQVLPLRLVFDVLPEASNRVSFDPMTPSKPVVHYAGHGAYTQRAIDRAQADLERILAPLPLQRVNIAPKEEATEAHIIGTTAMGNDPKTSIIDKNCVHHQLRNLIVLGSSTFPTGGPANPSLTIAAQAMRSADQVLI
jgi:choline dehydrogenase-like flavoprotein